METSAERDAKRLQAEMVDRQRLSRRRPDGWCDEHRRLKSACWPHGHRC